MPHKTVCELCNKHMQRLYCLGHDGLCDVLGPRLVQMGVQSKLRWPRHLPRQRRMERENALHEASECTKVEQVHTIRAQVLGIDPEALELTLDLIWLGITMHRPLIGVSMWPLARCARFMAELEPCDATARFSMLVPHVEVAVDAPV